MAHKTFISYKYDEARALRDEIIEVLGADATYYQGETSYSPDLTDLSTEAIKSKLTDMMYSTSVTIVIVSPNFTDSKWIDWEIEYCLKEITRKGRTSKTNGVVGVIQKHNGGYGWIVNNVTKPDGCSPRQFDDAKLYRIITGNRFNQKTKSYTCDNLQKLRSVDWILHFSH